MREVTSWKKPALKDVIECMCQVANVLPAYPINWQSGYIAMLQRILDSWCYAADPWFFDTTLVMLIFGCRVSECPTLSVEESGGTVNWSLYCEKQQIYREGKINAQDCNGLIRGVLNGNRRIYLDRKSYAYRMPRRFVDSTRYSNAQMMHAAHLMRHLWVSVLHYACYVPIDRLQTALRHANIITTYGYLFALRDGSGRPASPEEQETNF